MNADQKLDHIIERITNLEKLILASLPPGRKPIAQMIGAVYRPHEILALRKKELLRLFETCWKQGHVEKVKQGFNSAILRPVNGTGPAREIVPVSILMNRCSLRKAFAPIFEIEEVSSVENARLTLEACVTAGLVTVAPVADVANPATERSKPVTSQTKVIVSKAELARIGVTIVAVEKESVEPEIEFNLADELRSNTVSDTVSDSVSDDDEIIDDEGFEEE